MLLLGRKTWYFKASPVSFNLNNAVDELLKNEFDNFRGTKDNHLIIEYGIDAKPFEHPEMKIGELEIKVLVFR